MTTSHKRQISRRSDFINSSTHEPDFFQLTLPRMAEVANNNFPSLPSCLSCGRQIITIQKKSYEQVLLVAHQ